MTDVSAAFLAGLSRPEIFEGLNYPQILDRLINDFVSRANAAGFQYDVGTIKSDPIVKVLEAAANNTMLLRARGNDIARDNYLYYAAGAGLDHKGAFYDCVRLAGESDERFRERIILAIRGRSTGGTDPRYRYIALSSSLRVADVEIYVDRLNPTINVAVFAADNNGIADATLLRTVSDALNDSSVRMSSDRFTVRAAVVQVVDLILSFTLLPGAPESLVTTLAASLPAAWASIGGGGRDLTRDWIKAQCMVAGVHHVDTDLNADIVMQPFEAVRIGSVTASVVGVDY